MVSMLQIRNVPDETRYVLKARAAARGQSLNAYLVELLAREASRPTVAEVLERAACRSERAAVPALDVLDVERAERDQQFAAQTTSR